MSHDEGASVSDIKYPYAENRCTAAFFKIIIYLFRFLAGFLFLNPEFQNRPE